MDAAQRERPARSIVEEATRLARMTDNTLQLARLDAPGVALRCDWESAEEIVGAVFAAHVRAVGRAGACAHGSSPTCRCCGAMRC